MEDKKQHLVTLIRLFVDARLAPAYLSPKRRGPPDYHRLATYLLSASKGRHPDPIAIINALLDAPAQGIPSLPFRIDLDLARQAFPKVPCYRDFPCLMDEPADYIRRSDFNLRLLFRVVHAELVLNYSATIARLGDLNRARWVQRLSNYLLTLSANHLCDIMGHFGVRPSLTIQELAELLTERSWDFKVLPLLVRYERKLTLPWALLDLCDESLVRAELDHLNPRDSISVVDPATYLAQWSDFHPLTPPQVLPGLLTFLAGSYQSPLKLTQRQKRIMTQRYGIEHLDAWIINIIITAPSLDHPSLLKIPLNDLMAQTDQIPGNPYSYLRTSDLAMIAQERNLDLGNHRTVLVRELARYDKISPTYLEDARTLSIRSNRSEILIHNGLHGIDRRSSNLPTIHLLLDTVARIYIGRIGPDHLTPPDEIVELIYELTEPDLRYLARACFPDPFLETFLERDGLIFALLQGHLRQKDRVDPETYRRYRDICLSPPSYQALLQQLAGVDRLEALRFTPVPHEDLLLALLRGRDPVDLARSIGMLIPPHHDPEAYLLSNFIAYTQALSRPAPAQIDWEYIESFHQFTDCELQQQTGARVAYQSRIEHVQNLGSLVTNPGFFIPSAPFPWSRNTQTTLLTPLTDVKEAIAYGTLRSYLVYEVDELRLAFSSIESSFLFRRPDRPSESFPLGKIQGLYHLLPEGSPLHRQIGRGLILIEEQEEESRSFLLGPERPILRRWLHVLFETGMYMRRWLGPGHPYPMTATATLIDVDPAILTTVSLDRLEAIREQMSPALQAFTLNLPSVEGSTLAEEILSLRHGDSCIRVSSSTLTNSAHRYLQRFFLEGIPGFDPICLDEIE